MSGNDQGIWGLSKFLACDMVFHQHQPDSATRKPNTCTFNMNKT